MRPLSVPLAPTSYKPALYSAESLQLVACSVAWLTPAEAQAKKNVLLFQATAPVPDVAARADGRRAYRHRKPLLPGDQVTKYLDQLTHARMEMSTRMLTVRDTGRTTALLCWGYPLVERDWNSGALAVHPAMTQSFVAPGHLHRARRDVLLTLLAECLADEFGVPVQALLIPYKDVALPARGVPPIAVKQGSQLFMQGLARLTPLHPERGHAAGATRALRDKLLDPVVASLARQATGASFPLSDYNQVHAHRALYEQVNSQTPSLLPLLHRYLRQLPVELRELTVARGEEQVREGFDGARQSLLQSHGASKQIWKYLLRVPRSAIKACVSPAMASQLDLPPKQAMDRSLRRLGPLQRLCRVGVPAKQLASKTVRDGLMLLWARWDPAEHPQTPLELVRRFSTLALAQLRLTRARHLDHAEARLAAQRTLDWLVQEGFAHGHPRMKETWSDLLRREQEWHRRDQETQAAANAAARYARWKRDAAALEKKFSSQRSSDGLGWDGLLPPLEWGGLLAHPLRTAQALWDEHVLMHHCVDAYLEPCWSGASRLFHLADPERPRRRSTLELGRLPNGQWEERQHEGPCNQRPHPSLLPLAKELICRVRLVATGST